MSLNERLRELNSRAFGEAEWYGKPGVAFALWSAKIDTVNNNRYWDTLVPMVALTTGRAPEGKTTEPIVFLSRVLARTSEVKPYKADVDASGRPTDRFDAMQNLDAGDCEDGAKQVQLQIEWLRNYTGDRPDVRALRDLAHTVEAVILAVEATSTHPGGPPTSSTHAVAALVPDHGAPVLVETTSPTVPRPLQNDPYTASRARALAALKRAVPDADPELSRVVSIVDPNSDDGPALAGFYGKIIEILHEDGTLDKPKTPISVSSYINGVKPTVETVTLTDTEKLDLCQNMPPIAQPSADHATSTPLDLPTGRCEGDIITLWMTHRDYLLHRAAMIDYIAKTGATLVYAAVQQLPDAHIGPLAVFVLGLIPRSDLRRC